MSAMAGSTKRLARVLRLGVIVLAASFLGALCNPPPPACDAGTCPAGQHPIAGKCVKPVPPYGSCNINSICASGYMCVLGTCSPGPSLAASATTTSSPATTISL